MDTRPLHSRVLVHGLRVAPYARPRRLLAGGVNEVRTLRRRVVHRLRLPTDRVPAQIDQRHDIRLQPGNMSNTSVLGPHADFGGRHVRLVRRRRCGSCPDTSHFDANHRREGRERATLDGRGTLGN